MDPIGRLFPPGLPGTIVFVVLVCALAAVMLYVPVAVLTALDALFGRRKSNTSLDARATRCESDLTGVAALDQGAAAHQTRPGRAESTHSSAVDAQVDALSARPLHVRVAEVLGVEPGKRYDIDWAATGPLIEKRKIGISRHEDAWRAKFETDRVWTKSFYQFPSDRQMAEWAAHTGVGRTPLLAVCDLYLRAARGRRWLL